MRSRKPPSKVRRAVGRCGAAYLDPHEIQAGNRVVEADDLIPRIITSPSTAERIIPRALGPAATP